ncbi:ABC-type transport auxiliary lipoprotein family protein [Antarctobacter sp.]|uniref:ABC-type transport auxiliary lipoprotein family protein n=1 Tax=Antarctobacter sp. TaxID=1872577 RepID=UPI002B26600B|nr:ABC-type transport auxiliary lipoprotein family protein [Antarctobacter sp.]
MAFLVTLRSTALGLSMLAMAGCSAISSIQTASKPLDTFELSPLPAGTVSVRQSRRYLEVAMPSATGAFASDRIVVKPTPLKIESLPDARWINDATEHVQLLLVRSLANSGRFALVTAAGSGPSPDYVLMTDLQAFQAEVGADSVTIVVRSTMTLLSDTDGRVVSSRSFDTSATAPDTSREMVVAAFDAAMTAQLTEVLDWFAKTPLR